MNLIVITTMVALVCYLVLVYVVSRRGLRIRVNRFFVIYLITMVYWQIAALMVSISDTASMALLWYKLLMPALSAQFLIYFLFTQAFLRIRGQKWVIRLGILTWIVTMIAILSGTPHFIPGVYQDENTGLFVPDFGMLVMILAVLDYFVLGYGVFNLFRGYRWAQSDLERNRLRYLLLGIGVVILGTMANLVPSLKPYPIDITANIINAFLIAYAILRYRLLDITLVIRKGLLYFIPTAIIGAGYFLLISLVIGLFHAFAEPQILLVSLLVAVIAAVVVQPLRDRAQLWIDRLFFREKYDSSLMLQRLSHTAASVLDLDRLTGMILDEVTTTIHIERTAFFLRHEESGGFRLMAQRGPEQNADLRLRKDHPIVDWLSSHENALTRHDMEMMPQFKALWGEEKEDLERMGAELFIPLEAKGDLVGILAIGPKLSEVAYSQDDQLTLTTLANQAAVAIENARLYDAAQRELAERKRAEKTLKEYSERLEEMVEERTKELRDAQARLIQSEKLAATGRLAASVAHEINNPLQGISNYLSVISRQVAQDDPLHEDLDMVKLGFERIAEIVRRLRAFYRPAGEEMEPTDINGVVERVLALMGHQLSLGNVEVKTELAERELPVLGSAGQLEQVLVNLALNAQEAMPEGGELMVRTALRDNVVQLQVTDTGQGISEEEMSRLFRPFYSGRGGKGLGLGLWISHNIIEGHGGRIEVESRVGEGTTFTISLPAYQRER